MTLTKHERRILGFLDQRGPTHRREVVWALASPESKIGKARDVGSGIGRAGSGNGEPLIMGAWCKKLIEYDFIRSVYDAQGYYKEHEITVAGRHKLREADKGGAPS